MLLVIRVVTKYHIYMLETLFIASEITERKEKLNDLLPLLNVVIKAAKPLQEHLGMSGDHTRKEHCLANLLPDPLYILYANIIAYKSVFGMYQNVHLVLFLKVTLLVICN